MTEFYRYLIIESLEKSLSLQRSKQSMIESTDLAHPFYWAFYQAIASDVLAVSP